MIYGRDRQTLIQKYIFNKTNNSKKLKNNTHYDKIIYNQIPLIDVDSASTTH